MATLLKNAETLSRTMLEYGFCLAFSKLVSGILIVVGLGLSASHSGGTLGLVYIKVPLFKEFVQLPIKVHREPHVDHFFCLFVLLFI